MDVRVYFSIPLIYILGKFFEKLVDKMGEYLAEIIAEYVKAPFRDYVVAPIRCQLGYLRYKSNIQDYRNQIETLKELRVMVQELVDDAERKGEFIPKVQQWLTIVNDITEESKKFFDEELQVNLKLRYRRSRNAKEQTTVVDKLKQEGNRFVKESNGDGEVFKSRNLIFKKIMEALKDDRINMIGIYGMGGVGKTTLVGEVAKQVKDDNLFEEVVMAAVSSNPNLKRIQGEIADMLGMRFDEKSDSGRGRRLFARFEEKKRILVILDDIWERVELEAIGIPFGSRHEGCKILVTSRSQDVCNEMGTQKNFPIGVLSEEEGWTLFRKTVGDSVDSPVLHPLAVKVAKECAGLPIAIVTVARALKDKSLSDWTDAANRLRKSIPSKKVFSTLELSYNHLESEEAKSFFLLCCLFPEDWNIEIQDLMKYGMGLGLFLNVDTVDEARERAHKLANDLKSSCLLLDSGDEKRVKMHDSVRDVAISIASKDKHLFVVRAGLGWKELPKKDTFKQCTAISLMSNNIEELPGKLECPELQILLLENCSNLAQFPNNFFLSMDNLKVLDMSCMDFSILPPSLRYLKSLRTLCLDHCILNDISIIGELENLEILTFLGSTIKELPKEIGMLTCLRLLDLTICEKLTLIQPYVIQGLSHLEGLYMDGSFREWEIGRQDKKRNASLVELKYLSRLINLEIQISDANIFPEDLLFENLSRFKISIGTSFGILEQYSYSKFLKLELNLSTALKDGVKGLLKKADYLHLMNMKGLKSVLKDLDREGFRNLRCLNVHKCGEVEYIFEALEWVSHVALPILEKLDLWYLPNLKEICRGQLPSGFFRNLTAVKVWSCDGLKNLFSHSIAKDLLNLIEITVEGCENMEEIVGNEKEAEAVEMDNIVFPHLRSLVLQNLPNLKNFCSKMNCSVVNGGQDTDTKEPLFGEKVAFNNLEVLRIINIENLQDIFHSQIPDESFSHLRFLLVRGCHKLSRVAPSNLLPRLNNLEELIVEECNSMEAIFKLEQPAGKNDTAMSLFQLEKLKLRHLPNLGIFSSENYNFELPSLITLRLEVCSKMRIFSSGVISAPKLKAVETKNTEKVWKVDLNSTLQHLFEVKNGTNRYKTEEIKMTSTVGYVKAQKMEKKLKKSHQRKREKSEQEDAVKEEVGRGKKSIRA